MGLVLYLFKAVRRKREIRNDSLNYIIGRDINLAKGFFLSASQIFHMMRIRMKGQTDPGSPAWAGGDHKAAKGEVHGRNPMASQMLREAGQWKNKWDQSSGADAHLAHEEESRMVIR